VAREESSVTLVHDAITDVAGVRVGHSTITEGTARTGVTVIVPPELPCFAGWHRLNGNGELTGTAWIDEAGLLTTPIGLTNTHSVGVVRDAIVAALAKPRAWVLPVVGETWDGILNDINAMHVRPEHVEEALRSAADGPVAQGNVGGGTGMICHGFKGGIGTASRTTEHGYVVGVLVQANHGRRDRLRVDGRPVEADDVPRPGAPDGAGSIIGIAATDAPLLPHQCRRLAQRIGLGVARMGGGGEQTSGDLFLAFSTGNARLPTGELDERPEPVATVSMLADAYITELFDAVIDATEGAILNALLHAETMTGHDGTIAYAFPADRL
jgi:D-aminopeptidase